ncbi:MAG: M48 family metallopeptidase [Tepidisphaeraceae bacterium]
MSRILLLIVFLTWMSYGSSLYPQGDPVTMARPAEFMAGFAVLILLTAILCRRLAQRVEGGNLNDTLKRFNKLMTVARVAVPIWFFVGVSFMGWGALVNGHLAALELHPDRFDTPGLLVGSLPALLGWMGLWWAQYPAEIAFREQGMLAQIDAGLPVHRPPTLGSYLRANLRLQVLFTAVPVVVLISLRDVLALAVAPFGLSDENSAVVQLSLSLVTAAVVMLFAPELLKRLLETEPMPDGPLRQRLQEICQRHGIGCRDILLWRTDHNMGNAAVMGLVPRIRYVLMSDLLLETMTDEQIEAVFAHELGHIIHRHMLWFAVFFGTMMFALVGLSGPLQRLADHWTSQSTWPSALGTAAASVLCITIFLFLSRRFERQADVFAARTLQEESALLTVGASSEAAQSSPMNTGESGERSHVGLHGATVFSSALHQVARINCIPITAWSWCHGSIAKRMDYLQELSQHPGKTAEFDRFMSRLYAVLILSLCAFGVWAMIALSQQHG